MVAIARLALGALLASLPVHAETLTVGPPGSGADFNEIGDAVIAAAPGDVILVAAGQYDDYGTIVIDKPLSLIGAGSALTRFSALPENPFDTPLPLLVRDLPSGAEVRVAGLGLTPAALLGYGPTIAVVVDCAGPVVLADVSGGGSPALFGGVGAMQVRRSDQVLLDDCHVQAFPASATLGLSQPGLLIEDSQVHVNASTFDGGSGILTDAGIGSDGAPGIHAIRSVVRLSRSTVTGGDGGGSWLFGTTTDPGDGAAALLAEQSTAFLRQATLRGGEGGFGNDGPIAYSAPGASAIVMSSDALATTTPAVVLLPGFDGDGGVTAPPVSPTGTWTQLAERMATLALDPKIAAPGDVTILSFGGEPGALFFSFFAFDQAPALSIPGVPGVVVLPLGAYVSLPAAALGAAGGTALPVAVPALPTLGGLSLLVQGLAASPLGTLSISAPALVAVVQ